MQLLLTLVLFWQDSEHTISPVTTHDEGTQHTPELAQPVTPCSMPASLKYYCWQPPEATIAEVNSFPPNCSFTNQVCTYSYNIWRRRSKKEYNFVPLLVTTGEEEKTLYGNP